MALTPVSVSFLKESIGEYDMILLQMEISMDVNEAVIDIAADAGIPVLLNPAPANPIKDKVLQKLTYLVPNETEATVLTGIRIRDEEGRICLESAERAAKALLSRGVKNVIITLGDAGAICVAKDSMDYCPNNGWPWQCCCRSALRNSRCSVEPYGP